MDGLEAVEIRLSECKSIVDFRIDSTTFKKKYLQTEKLLKSIKTKSIEDCSNSVQNFGAYSLCSHITFVDDGTPFLMTQNIRKNYISWTDVRFIDDKSHEMLVKSHCKNGQVLLTMAGEYLGRAAVYNEDSICSSNQAIAKITLNKNENPYFISTFLNTKYGQNQINRFKTITGQPNINMTLIKTLLIPELSLQFQELIEEVCKKFNLLIADSHTAYKEAEDIVLMELGLTGYNPSCEQTSIKLFSESFKQTDRLDAEHYQLKYDVIIEHIRNYRNGFTQLSNEFEQNKNIISKNKDSYKYIEISDITIGNGQADFNIVSTSDLPANAKIKVEKGDLLYSTVRPYRGAVAIINYDEDDLICSGAFTVIQEKGNYLKECAFTLLRTPVYKEYIMKYSVGSSYPTVKDNDVMNLLIPQIPQNIQNEIKTLVKQGIEFNNKAIEYLENAKQAVEIALEQGENFSIEWLKNQMK